MTASPYAVYVWTAYAVSLAGLAAVTLATLLAWRRAKRRAAAAGVQLLETKT